MLNKVKSLGHDIVSLVFMDLCIGCYKADPVGNQDFCLPCLSLLPYVQNQEDVNAAVIGKGALPQEIKHIHSLLYYTKSGIMKDILYNLKYGNRPAIGVKLGEQLGTKLVASQHKDSILVPVPLHPKRLKKRGYNQALKIAQGIHKTTQIPIAEGILKRVQNNKSQTKMGVIERQGDVNLRFALDNKRPRQKAPKAIIVDDVITTGSTIHACYHWLTLAGYQEIYVATLAITI